MEQVVADWFRQGKPVNSKGVPHEVKAHLIQAYAETFGLDVLVETGTCHGAMIQAVGKDFEEVHTIEMYEPNYEIACERLASMDWVRCYFGDSGETLEQIVNGLDSPALFFLDAHYSGGGTARGAVDTPVVQELDTLSRSPFPNVVIIDDARLFNGEAYYTEEFVDYPSFEWIQDFVATNFQVASTVIHDGDEFVIMPVP